MTQSETLIGNSPEAMRVWILGGFRVSVGAGTFGDEEWRLRKAASLVKLLALAESHRLHREQAMDLLWPRLGRAAASDNLRQVLHAARHTLAPTDGSLHHLASDGDSLVLCPKTVEDRLRGWIVGTVIVSLFVGISGGVGLWIIGVPLYISIGLIRGMLNVVPYLGSTVGALLPALVALTISPIKALLVVVLNQAEGYILQP